MKTPNYIDRHVGSRLRLLRLSRKMTPESLAQALGLPTERLASIEAGRERVSADLMRKLSRILNAPPSEFFAGLARGGEGALKKESAETPPAEQEKQLLKDFARVRDAKSRMLILALVAAYAEFGDFAEK